MTAPFYWYPYPLPGTAQETDPNSLPHRHWPLWFKVFVPIFRYSQRCQQGLGGTVLSMNHFPGGGGADLGDKGCCLCLAGRYLFLVLWYGHVIALQQTELLEPVLWLPSYCPSVYRTASWHTTKMPHPVASLSLWVTLSHHPQHSYHVKWPPAVLSTLRITESGLRFLNRWTCPIHGPRIKNGYVSNTKSWTYLKQYKTFCDVFIQLHCAVFKSELCR